MESVLSHALPFSKIKQRHFVGHLRYFYLYLQGPWGNGSRERIWKEDLYLMILRLYFKLCIFSSLFACLLKHQERKTARGVEEETERERGGWSIDLNTSQYLKTKNKIIIF